MATRAQNRILGREGLTATGQKYLDIVIDEYGGVVPYGQRAGIARRLGCSPETLAKFDRGENQAWTSEYKQRLLDVIPLSSPVSQMIALQKLYDSAIEHREQNSMPLTSKDPVDILEVARKVTLGPGGDRVINNTQINNTVIDMSGYSDDDLASAVQGLTKFLRDNDAGSIGDTIEEISTEIPREYNSGAAEADDTEGPEMPAEPGRAVVLA